IGQELGQALERRNRRIVRRGQALVERNAPPAAVMKDEVSEGAADVEADAISHSCSFRSLAPRARDAGILLSLRGNARSAGPRPRGESSDETGPRPRGITSATTSAQAASIPTRRNTVWAAAPTADNALAISAAAMVSRSAGVKSLLRASPRPGAERAT